MAFSNKTWSNIESPKSPFWCCKKEGEQLNLWQQLMSDIDEIINILKASGISDTCLNDAGLPFTFWSGECFDSDKSIIFNVLGVSEGIVDKVIDVGESDATETNCLNLYLKPSTHGYVKFGSYASDVSEPVITGYITIVDSSGKLRKLAVIDDNDESQPSLGDIQL